MMDLTLNARQLHQAWQLANPDAGDQDQEETEITIRWWPGGKDIAGDDQQAGYYAHLTEYPEEGSLYLDPERPIDGAAPSVEPSGETMAQREEVCAAWFDMPESLRCHPSMKRLYRALGGPAERTSGVTEGQKP